MIPTVAVVPQSVPKPLACQSLCHSLSSQAGLLAQCQEVSPALKPYVGSGNEQRLELNKCAAARTLSSDVVNILIRSRFSRKRSTSPPSTSGGEGPPGRRP